MTNLRPFLAHYREYHRRLGVIVVLSLLGGLAEASLLVTIVPVATALVDDTEQVVVDLGPFDGDLALSTILGIAAALVVATVALQVAIGYLSISASANWQENKRLEVYRAFFGSSLATQERDRGGKLVAVTGPNVNKGASGVRNLSAAARGLFGLLMFLVVAVLVDPWASLGMTVFGALLLALLRPIAILAKRLQRRIAEQNVDLADDLSDYAGFAREVRLFDAGEPVLGRLTGQVEEIRSLRVRSGAIMSLPTPLYRAVTTLAVLGVAGFALDRDATDAATLGAVALLLYRSIAYGQMLQGAYNSILLTLPYLEHLEDELAVFRDDPAAGGEVEIAGLEEIRLEHVGYRYDDESQALHDIELRLTRGEKVGVVGPSGSGKSTLAQVLLRLRLPTDGRVLADGRPYEEISASSWYRSVALVPQEARLLHDTVGANIGFYRPNLGADDIVRAAREAGIHETIAALPDGYDTEVGAAIRNLSGGQIQRIAIARALAGRPDVLVLDEPTSALDVSSEAVVQDTIEAMGEDVLVVVIAHRLSTLSVCDRLLLLDGGHLVEDGPPEQVLASSRFYAVGHDLT